MANVKKQITVFKLQNGAEVSVSLSAGSHMTTERHEWMARKLVNAVVVDTHTKVLYG